jgi:subfamily B ATP-binding cassette protein MsbA
LDNNPTIVDNLKTKEIIDSKGELEFVNVSFSYPNTYQYVLKNVSLRITPGETIALVGPSGAGKSTLLNLVPRFYDSTEGTVKIDKIDVKDLSLESVRDSSSLVTQDALIFDTSVRENIMFGAKGVDEDVFMSVCKETLVDEFVKEFPDGYETVVGEGGVKISGGQRQRIAIARAMIKDSPILLLDEATSSLDSESEQKVQIALLALLKEKSALIIAHRLSTVRDADMIYVFDKGQIVEKGKHEQLLDNKGLYSLLFKTQFPENAIE